MSILWTFQEREMEGKNIRFNITIKNKVGSELGRFQIETSSMSEALEKAKDCIGQRYREKGFLSIS